MLNVAISPNYHWPLCLMLVIMAVGLNIISLPAWASLWLCNKLKVQFQEFASLVLVSSNNKTLNARLLARHKFVTGATLLQLVVTGNLYSLYQTS